MLKGLETLPIVGSGAGRGQWQCSIDTSKGQSGSPVLRVSDKSILGFKFIMLTFNSLDLQQYHSVSRYFQCLFKSHLHLFRLLILAESVYRHFVREFSAHVTYVY